MTLVALAAAVALPLAGPASGPPPPAPPPRPGTFARLTRGVRPYVRLDGMPVGGLLPAEVDILLDELARVRDRAPHEATLDRRTGAVVPERDGIRLDEAATRAALLHAVPFGRVKTVMRPVPARWHTADIRRLTATLGVYRTWISGTSERRQNIIVASNLLRRRVIYPGRTFSFVAAVGPGSRAQGYRRAPPIQDGQMVPGMGGGVCQVSSTLYNAARAAGLAIVERHHHGLPVHYVPPGRDATIVLPGEHPPPWLPHLDLKIRNSLSRPVYLDPEVTGWRLTVRVVGDPALVPRKPSAPKPARRTVRRPA